MLPKHVKIVEVGPRDGLQNEHDFVPTETKINFINQLSESGLQFIECTAFVSAKWIPQMADAKSVFSSIKQKGTVEYSALTPNIKGLESAMEVGVKHIAFFTAASETFSQRNTNCSIDESLQRLRILMDTAKSHSLKVRAYISCVIACPYEGDIDPKKVATLSQQLVKMGCDEISLGDTIGVGTPEKVQKVIKEVKTVMPVHDIAGHFHDTYGQALVNIYAALEEGVSIFDSSVAGLGGCPYAKGATGNVATEDVVYLMNGLKIDTGIDLNKLVQAGDFISKSLKLPNRSKVANALLAKENT